MNHIRKFTLCEYITLIEFFDVKNSYIYFANYYTNHCEKPSFKVAKVLSFGLFL